ncbi:MAG: MoaD/ThiS family protein [Thermoplasmata archaeon]
MSALVLPLVPTGVRLLFFASARQAVGHARLERTVPSGGLTAERLLDDLVAEFPRLRRILPSCRLVVNGEYVGSRSHRLGPGDEVAVHPPYSGG